MSNLTDAQVKTAWDRYVETSINTENSNLDCMRAVLEAVSSIHEAEPVDENGTEHQIFNILVHDYPAPYAKVSALAKKLARVAAHPAPIHEAEPVKPFFATAHLTLDGFAEWLTAAMDERGATVRRLAETLGIDKSAISRARTGKGIEARHFIQLWNWLAHPAPISKRVTVKTLQWEANGRASNSWWTGELIFEDYYTATDEATGWRVFRHRFLSEADPIEVAYVASLVQAKATAQADFDTRVRSCLSHAAGEIEAGGETERLTRERDQAQGIAQTLLAAAEADLALMQDAAQTVLSLQSRAEAADKRIAELEATLAERTLNVPPPSL